MRKWRQIDAERASAPDSRGGDQMSGPSEDSRRIPKEDKRMSIRLSPQAQQAVDEIMKLGDFKTYQEAIRRAIADERFLLQRRREGWTVLLRKGDEDRELEWTPS
jgi:Arc/MetJ-type ribon-helix-helix transcriptional regulator